MRIARQTLSMTQRWRALLSYSKDSGRVTSVCLFQNLVTNWLISPGIVSTAYIADATPGALTAHTRNRDLYGQVVDSYLRGNTNYTWTNWTGPAVLFGGGAEQFFPNEESFNGDDYYKLFGDAGYNVVLNKTSLLDTANDTKTLGIFSLSNMAKWLDRNVYTENLKGNEDAPDGKGGDATDQPGLKEMTIKALEILTTRSSEKGFFLMSEAASIDKMMHALDYDRALGDLLELDDTVKAAIEFLEGTGQLNDTLVLVTADHGHGFDVMGSVDTRYLNAQADDRSKRKAVGTYKQSGLSQYQVANASGGNDSNLVYSEGTYFPVNWDPRYTLFSGLGANPDHREAYQISQTGPRKPTTNTTEDDFYVNPEDSPSGFIVNGTLPPDAAQGVHSLTDVPVFAQGPCQELFGGVYGNIDVFYGMAECLGLSRTSK